MATGKVLGIWDENQGGFIYGPMHDQEEAEAALEEAKDEYFRHDEDAEALTLAEFCPEHWGDNEPKDACDQCAEAGEEY